MNVSGVWIIILVIKKPLIINFITALQNNKSGAPDFFG